MWATSGEHGRCIALLGAVGGDVAGSIYEFRPDKREDIPLLTAESTFTDDSVLTLATAEVLLEGGTYAEAYHHYGRTYPGRGYGGNFSRWLASDRPEPYGSFGNGSAMRVSPVGFFCGSMAQVLSEAARSAAVTHDHPEGIKGAQAVAGAIFLARTGEDKRTIRAFVEATGGYDLSVSVATLRPRYAFDESCQGTVPAALVAFLDASDYTDTLRKAISLGGDADTLACIAGSVAAAFYRTLPEPFARIVLSLLPSELRALLERFDRMYGVAPDDRAES